MRRGKGPDHAVVFRAGRPDAKGQEASGASCGVVVPARWLVLALVPLAGCLGTENPLHEEAPDCGDLQLVEHSNHAFCVAPGWDYSAQNDFGAAWVAFAPSDGDADGFRENMNLMITPGRSGGDLDAVVKAQKKAIEDVADEFEDLGTTASRVGTQPAKTVNYRVVLGDAQFEGSQTIVFANDKAFILTYSTGVGYAGQADADVADMMASFRFL